MKYQILIKLGLRINTKHYLMIRLQLYMHCLLNISTWLEVGGATMTSSQNCLISSTHFFFEVTLNFAVLNKILSRFYKIHLTRLSRIQ